MIKLVHSCTSALWRFLDLGCFFQVFYQRTLHLAFGLVGIHTAAASKWPIGVLNLFLSN